MVRTGSCQPWPGALLGGTHGQRPPTQRRRDWGLAAESPTAALPPCSARGPRLGRQGGRYGGDLVSPLSSRVLSGLLCGPWLSIRIRRAVRRRDTPRGELCLPHPRGRCPRLHPSSGRLLRPLRPFAVGIGSWRAVDLAAPAIPLTVQGAAPPVVTQPVQPAPLPGPARGSMTPSRHSPADAHAKARPQRPDPT